MTPEGKVKASVKDILAKYAHCCYYRMHVPAGYGKPTLDFDGAICGRAFSIEAKALGKPLSARQLLTIEAMEVGGVQVFVIDGLAGCIVLDNWLRAMSRSQSP
jgi:hypothetical protein